MSTQNSVVLKLKLNPGADLVLKRQVTGHKHPNRTPEMIWHRREVGVGCTWLREEEETIRQRWKT